MVWFAPLSGSVPCTDNELPDARVAAVEELPGGGDDVMVQELAPLHHLIANKDAEPKGH